jgi:hypothetical protein
MKYVRTIDIPASAAATWAVVEDVVAYPHWAPTFQAVELEGPMRVGTRARITQPRRGTATFRIQVLEPGRRFQWGAGRAVWVQSADHVVEPTGPASCRVTLTFEMTGLLGEPAARLAVRAVRGMVDQEAEALLGCVAGSAGDRGGELLE